jgi:serine/threonine protein kinase/tetratricopeptide (TPR) repeat protein
MDNSSLAAGAIISHYRIVSKLGAGGMGEVYLAQDTKLDRDVALKILPAAVASNRDHMERFVREAKAAAALNHPNIAHIYEIGESDDIHFIAMEYVDGATLGEKFHSEKTDLRKLLRYLQQVAEGLAKAHAAGIVHRDLKPDNIMVTRDGHAKVLDFGLAKLVEPQRTFDLGETGSSEVATAVMPQHSLPGSVIGTVGYMSPEQAQGRVKEIDHRSDMFSFGCILFEAATGQMAFEGRDILDSLHKIVHGPTPQIRDFNATTPHELQRIVRRCLAKDPEERYQTVRDIAIEIEELRRELEGAVTNLDISRPESGTARDQTVSRRVSTSAAAVSTRTSSAEYVISGLKQHKTITGAVLVILITLAAIGYHYFARGNIAIDSVAVLPFDNTAGDPNAEYLSDGVTESIINSLSQLPELKVMARSTVFRYKGREVDPQTAGRELGVRAVLTGRMLQQGESLLVSAELVNVSDGTHLWGEQYNRRMSDLATAQQEIASDISEHLRVRLSGEEKRHLNRGGTSNAEAYQLYLKGRYYWTKRTAESINKAIEEFQQAAQKDPNYALVYVGLADCYLLLEEYAGSSANDTYPKAKFFAERALQIDDSLAEAHTSLAFAYMYLRHWGEAEKEFKRAISLNPNYPTAHQWYNLYLRNMRRFDEALAEVKRAQELDPLSLVINANIARIYLAKGDVNSAIEQCKKTMELDPNFPIARELLGLGYLKLGRYSEAIAELKKAVDLSGRSKRYLSSLGYCYAILGKRAEALAIIKELEEKNSKGEAVGQALARLYTGLGDKDKAFAWLEKDFQAQTGLLPEIVWDEQFDSLRGDPRYVDLLRRMGLQP